jgi:penicillin V acylase-like amidase (Ntn superfamily)
MCTSLSLTDASANAYVGRTMEFAGAMPWQVSYFPKGLKFTSQITSSQTGIYLLVLLGIPIKTYKLFMV